MRRLAGRLFSQFGLTLVLSVIVALSGIQLAALDAPQTHTYYIAADEVEWDYAPSGMNKMMGMKFEGYPLTFIEQGPHRIGKVYRKAVYREYTDETFSHLKPRAPGVGTRGDTWSNHSR